MSDVKLLLVGDTNVGRPDPDSAFAPALPLLRDADIGFCNLGQLTAGGLTQFILYMNQLAFPIRAAAQIINSRTSSSSSMGYLIEK